MQRFELKMSMVAPIFVAFLAACTGLKPPTGPVAPEHGVRLTYGVQLEASDDAKVAQADVVRVLDQRLDDSGVLKYRVAPGEGGRVVVDLEAEGVAAGRPVLQVPGVLTFHAVDDNFQPALGRFLQSTEGDGSTRTTALQGRGDLPANRMLRLDGKNTPYILIADPMLSNEHVSSAVRRDEPWGVAVLAEFTDEGKTRFADATTKLVGQRLAIVFDGVVMSAPVIREPITGGQAMISLGDELDPKRVAHELVSVLRSGALPRPLVLETEEAF